MSKESSKCRAVYAVAADGVSDSGHQLYTIHQAPVPGADNSTLYVAAEPVEQPMQWHAPSHPGYFDGLTPPSSWTKIDPQPKPEQAVGDGVAQDISARIGCTSETEWFVKLVHQGHTVRTFHTFPTREDAEKYLEGVNLWLGRSDPRPAVATPAEVTDEQIREWCEHHDIFSYGAHLTDARAAFEDAQSLAAQPSAVSVPEGWKLVPVELTPEMRIAWMDAACLPEAEWVALLAAAPVSKLETTAFQARVSVWMERCFLPSLYSNMTERGDRLLEEVLELLQSKGYDRARVATLVDYVYGRPAGEPSQEVGGVMVTLAGLCWIAGLDMHTDGEHELTRISQPEVMAKIRAKQEAKNALHFDSPLPGNVSGIS